MTTSATGENHVQRGGSATASAAIQADGLTKHFGGTQAVDGIDLTIEQGELFALLGPNGAGKTTTVKLLCCLLRPTAGRATVMGHDVRRDPLAVKRVIDISPQETAIAGHLTAWENLRLIAGLHGLDRTRSQRRAQQLLEVVGLTDRANQRVRRYSGGMKRRLSLAMALISDPQVVFLDEPTLGLDPQSRRALWEHIAELKGTTTIVLTTHYLEEADALADRIAIMDEGRIIAGGTPDELKRGRADTPITVIEANLDDEAVVALRGLYPNTRVTDSGVEIEAAEVDLYRIQDVLRPLGVQVQASYPKRTTLDDVFLALTGKRLRA